MRILRDHGRALEYDLMTRTGRTLEEYMNMGAAGKVALISFIENLPIDSALGKALNPKDEFIPWHSQLKTNFILADIYDAFVRSKTPKGKKAATYPRPTGSKGIGKDAIPVSSFWDWWKKGR